MLTTPEISVVITVFNKATYIENVIYSYLTQFAGDSLELILVDDNSSDNSVNIIEKISKKYKNIKLIRNSENLGPSIRLNQGFRLARGSYILFADGDDIASPKSIEKLIKLMKIHDSDMLKAPYGGRIFKDISEIGFLDSIADKLNFKTVDNPLSYIIKKRQIGMGGLMINRELANNFQGCDEEVFVQDISIHLELGKYARRLMVLSESFLFGFQDNDQSLTRRQPVQAQYDLILSYKNFYERNINLLHKNDITRMVKKSASAMWKSQKRSQKLNIKLYFYYYGLYLRGKLKLYKYPLSYMQVLLDSFNSFDYIRKNKIV